MFVDNFLLEWHPESLRLRGSTRPRVYIIDFETAIDFDADAALHDCLTQDWPFPKESYERPLPPELEGDAPYCPFKLDVWQFAYGLRCFRVSSLFLVIRPDAESIQTTIEDVDTVLASMTESKPASRPSAMGVLDTLYHVVGGLPRSSLHISPICL